MKNTFKLAGSEVKQIPIKNIISDSRGFYTTSLPQKYVISKESKVTAERYVVNRVVGSENPGTMDYVGKISMSVFDSEMQSWIWDSWLNNYID